MGRKRYVVRKDAGKIKRENDEKILVAMREIIEQEKRANECYSDADLANMICSVGLLTNKGQTYNMRLKHGIPNMRERRILNFSQQHKN